MDELTPTNVEGLLEYAKKVAKTRIRDKQVREEVLSRFGLSLARRIAADREPIYIGDRQLLGLSQIPQLRVWIELVIMQHLNNVRKKEQEQSATEKSIEDLTGEEFQRLYVEMKPDMSMREAAARLKCDYRATRFLELLRNGLSVTDAAAAVGWNLAWAYRKLATWRKKLCL